GKRGCHARPARNTQSCGCEEAVEGNIMGTQDCPEVLTPGSFVFSLAGGQSYFLRRLRRPAPRDPRPRSPSRGSGEAVCGSLPLACPEGAFWSISLMWRTWFPFWSEVVAEVCPAF